MILITGASKGIGKYLLMKYTKGQEKVFGTYNSTMPKEKAKDKKYFKVNITSK